MKKTVLTVIMMALIPIGVKAQQAITFVGGSERGASGSISLSCGEVAVQRSIAKAITVVNITQYFTEGVQQSFASGKNDISSPLPFKVTVSPNPTHDWVEIAINDAMEQNGLKYTLYTLKGENIKSSTINGDRTDIDLTSLPAGTYMLRIEGENRNEKNIYKIIKAN